MANLFWGLDSENGHWQALPASPFLIPAFFLYLSFCLFVISKERDELHCRLNTGKGKELGLRRVQIRKLLLDDNLDDKTIQELRYESLSIDKQFQSLL